VVDELKLQAGDLADNDDGRREVGRLARIRYLVLGSVSALGGVTVNARLVDVNTGLIVQTGKINAATPEEAIKLLPQLGQMLMMNDADRITLENQLAQKGPADVVPVEPAAALPPPPPPPGPDQQPPPPLVVFNPRPPAFGELRPGDLDQLPLAPAVLVAPPPVIVLPAEDPFRRRMLWLSLQLGHHLLRRGRFREAHRQFELALNIAPGEIDVRIRIDRVRPLLPPPPVVVVPDPVVIVPPPVIVRPRIAVLSFFVNA